MLSAIIDCLAPCSLLLADGSKIVLSIDVSLFSGSAIEIDSLIVTQRYPSHHSNNDTKQKYATQE